MLKREKCVEYYFDSKEYNEKEIIENMEKEEIGFEKKKSEINIILNEYGIYVVKLKFINKKIKNNNKIIQKEQNKENKKIKTRKRYKGYETYNSNGKIYGQYKTTKTYQPI